MTIRFFFYKNKMCKIFEKKSNFNFEENLKLAIEMECDFPQMHDFCNFLCLSCPQHQPPPSLRIEPFLSLVVGMTANKKK